MNNQRILKFRIWHIREKQLIVTHQEGWEHQPQVCLSVNGEVLYADNMGAFVESNQENYLIQQFTNLKDKNGKEIFEGDIVKYSVEYPIDDKELGERGKIYVVQWTDKCYGKKIGFDLIDDDGNPADFYGGFCPEHCMVIGVSFKTPEPLNPQPTK